MTIFIIVLIALAAGAVAFGLGFLTFVLLKARKTGGLMQSLGMTLFLVKMRKYEDKNEQPKDFKLLIETMEQIYTQFIYLKKPGFFKKFFYCCSCHIL